jgi:hypothetical protein
MLDARRVRARYAILAAILVGAPLAVAHVACSRAPVQRRVVPLEQPKLPEAKPIPTAELRAAVAGAWDDEKSAREAMDRVRDVAVVRQKEVIRTPESSRTGSILRRGYEEHLRKAERAETRQEMKEATEGLLAILEGHEVLDRVK